MDAETGEVRLSVVSLSIQGETVADIAEKKAESSLNDFKSNIYNPMISNLQKQIDGQIENVLLRLRAYAQQRSGERMGYRGEEDGS